MTWPSSWFSSRFSFLTFSDVYLLLEVLHCTRTTSNCSLSVPFFLCDVYRMTVWPRLSWLLSDSVSFYLFLILLLPCVFSCSFCCLKYALEGSMSMDDWFCSFFFGCVVGGSSSEKNKENKNNKEEDTEICLVIGSVTRMTFTSFWFLFDLFLTFIYCLKYFAAQKPRLTPPYLIPLPGRGSQIGSVAWMASASLWVLLTFYWILFVVWSIVQGDTTVAEYWIDHFFASVVAVPGQQGN